MFSHYKKIFLFACVMVTSLFSVQAASKEFSTEKPLKVLFLILASDHELVYSKHQEIWRSYMHSDPEHIESYFFVRSNNYTADYEIKGDVIYCKSTQEMIPGILNGTLLALEAMLPRLEEFDYIVRPNLSSFYIFPRLLDYLAKQPRELTLIGYPMPWDGFNYPSGCGVIMSKDLAMMLINAKDSLFNYSQWDDVAIGEFFFKNGIPFVHSDMLWLTSQEKWLEVKDHFPEHIFHCRCRNDNPSLRSTVEIEMMKELVKMFYPNSTTK